jgi:hypothetical protein
MSSKRLPHPGRTLAQRRALDAIRCGEPPRCSPTTLKALLDAGLVEETGSTIRRDALGSYRVPAYEMPLPVHMQCAQPWLRPMGKWPRSRLNWRI